MKSGEHITFTYDGQDLEGTVVDVKDDVTIKLSSGYNIIAPKKNLKNVKSSAPKKSAQKSAPKVKPNTKLPLVQILHTGGTIASKVDYSTGGVIAGFSEEEIQTMFPEIFELANIQSTLIGNMQSEMMVIAHWNVLAKGIEKAVKDGAKGVIITHGTDIIHMTSAALAFAVQNCPIPVLLVGCQRSSDRPSSDAASNLTCATKFIVENSDFQGVGICMHEGMQKDDCVIFPATRTRKMHTSRRDAFKAINDKPYARISYPKLQIVKIQEFPKANGKLSIKPFNEKLKIGMLFTHPSMYAKEIEFYKDFDGLILAITGIGNAPTMQTDAYNKENATVLKVIQSVAKKIPVAVAPQTIFGRINLNVYTPGRQLIDAGVLGQGCDMTPDVAFVKLAWLLSNYKDKEVRELYNKNLIGEISQRSEDEGFLE